MSTELTIASHAEILPTPASAGVQIVPAVTAARVEVLRVFQTRQQRPQPI